MRQAATREHIAEQLGDLNDVPPEDAHFWLCATCRRKLERGNTPSLSILNNMALDPIPPELAGLNHMEVRPTICMLHCLVCMHTCWHGYRTWVRIQHVSCSRNQNV
jgi:hypothetical protein